MKRKSRVIWIIASIVMFSASIGLILYYLWGNGYLKKAKTAPASPTYVEFTYPSIDEADIAALTSQTTEPKDQQESSAPSVPEETAPAYECPVDFDELQHANPEIIGWLYMSEPQISLPVLRSFTDDTWYLYRDAVGNYARAGSLFVEHEYNTFDFSDPVTVIYGHRMNNGSMFGTLQATLSEKDYFDEERLIILFTPQKTRIYKIFATLPSDSDHILYYNDFNADGVFEAYFDEIFSESGVDVRLIPEAKPSKGDHVLVLSSCLWGDRSRRYLVFAKEID